MARPDSPTTTTQHFDTRASCHSLDSTTASYQEALPLCPTSSQVTRSSTLFEADRPRKRIENSQ
ncbi:D-alanine--D-alanine ligase [Streptomyces sp. NWU339]|nr:D-alanine--D-alanine ligase [Streptomyces sp. NWU339]